MHIINRRRVTFILLFICYVAIVSYVGKVIMPISTVTSASMEPTLMTGRHVLMNNYAYHKKTPQRGDIVTFKESDGTVVCKRIVGIEGDEIEFHNGHVYINGDYYDESSYLSDDVETNSVSTFTVPEGCVFLMGDNREDSYDSRFWENPYLEISAITSRVICQLPF